MLNFNVNGVNIEENDKRSLPTISHPRDIQRQQIQSNNGVNLFQNEQSMSLQFCDLAKEMQGVFNKHLPTEISGSMVICQCIIHAENNVKTPNNIRDRELNAVIRIGTDFVSNYYEIRIPLYINTAECRPCRSEFRCLQ